MLYAEGAAVDISSFIAKLTASITPADIVGILVQLIGIGMGFFLMWLGVRKAIKVFTGAVQHGNLKGV